MFINWCDECTEMADVVGSNEERPGTTKYQRHRLNDDAATTAEYYKMAFAILFLDHLLQSLRDRFSNEDGAVVSAWSIIAAIVVSEQDLQGLAGQLKIYEPDLPLTAPLVNELRRWRFCWIQKKQTGTTIPDTMKYTLGYADEDCFSSIRILLILGCTLPVTSAEAERSFYLLRQLKTHLSSGMTEARLSSLTLVSMHYHICLDLKTQDVAKGFIKDHPRRLYQPNLFTR